MDCERRTVHDFSMWPSATVIKGGASEGAGVGAEGKRGRRGVSMSVEEGCIAWPPSAPCWLRAIGLGRGGREEGDKGGMVRGLVSRIVAVSRLVEFLPSAFESQPLNSIVCKSSALQPSPPTLRPANGLLGDFLSKIASLSASEVLLAIEDSTINEKKTTTQYTYLRARGT